MIYAVNMTSDDIGAANVWGDIKYINHNYIYGDQIKNQRPPINFEARIHRMAEEFQQHNDFLLIAGDHLQIAMACAALAVRYRWFRVLRWDRQEKGYFPVTITAAVG